MASSSITDCWEIDGQIFQRPTTSNSQDFWYCTPTRWAEWLTEATSSDARLKSAARKRIRKFDTARRIMETEEGAPARTPCETCESRSNQGIECRVFKDKNQRHRPCAYCVRSAKGGCDTGQTAYMSIPKVGKELMLARARAKELSQHVAAIRAKQSNAPRQSDLGQQSPSFATSDSEEYVPRPTRRPRAKQPDAPSRQSNLGQDSLLSAISDSEDDVVRPTKRRRTCMMTTSTVDVVNVGALAKSIDTIQYEDEDSDSSELSKLDSTIAFDHTIEPALIKTEIADESRVEANGGDTRPLQNGADPIRAESITRTIPVSLLSQPVHMMQQQNEGDSSSTTIPAAPVVHERNSTQQQANNNNNNNNPPPPSNNTARDRLILRAVTQARNSFWPRVAELVNFGLEQPDHHHHHHQLTAEEVKRAYERIDVTDRALLG